MNSDIKARWIAALRSGEYRQGTRKLHQGDLFCCLGVLCDIAVKDGVIDPPTRVFDMDDIFEYEHSTDVLPDKVVEWAWLPSGNPTPPGDERMSLAMMNDTGSSFTEIADFIEEYF